jgi:hypothetical protein
VTQGKENIMERNFQIGDEVAVTRLVLNKYGSVHIGRYMAEVIALEKTSDGCKARLQIKIKNVPASQASYTVTSDMLDVLVDTDTNKLVMYSLDDSEEVIKEFKERCKTAIISDIYDINDKIKNLSQEIDDRVGLLDIINKLDFTAVNQLANIQKEADD